MITCGGWVSKSDFGLGWFLWTFFCLVLHSVCFHFSCYLAVHTPRLHPWLFIRVRSDRIKFMFPVSGVDPSN